MLPGFLEICLPGIYPGTLGLLPVLEWLFGVLRCSGCIGSGFVRAFPLLFSSCV